MMWSFHLINRLFLEPSSGFEVYVGATFVFMFCLHLFLGFEVVDATHGCFRKSVDVCDPVGFTYEFPRRGDSIKHFQS